jgi:SAM-dependent methyltransferase
MPAAQPVRRERIAPEHPAQDFENPVHPKAVKTRSCEVCGSTETRPLPAYSRVEWPVVACARCGFVYQHKVPGHEALVETFAWEKTFAEERRRRSQRSWSRLDQATRWRLRPGKRQEKIWYGKLLRSGGNVLDIGCGGSCRLPPGVTPYGIEISAALAAKADPLFRARGGYVVSGSGEEGLSAFADAFFSTIFMRSYLEHEEHPRAVLTAAFAKLKPGGRVAVRVPNYGSLNRRVMGAQWCGFRFPDHVNYFTDGSLKALAASVGFRYRRCNRLMVLDDNLIVELIKPS